MGERGRHNIANRGVSSWWLLPPLVRSERCRSTPGRITAPTAHRTPPPTLRREGTRDHGPAPGKLRGRRFIPRQPKSAIPMATYRRHHYEAIGGPPSHTRRPPSLRGLHYLMPALAIALFDASPSNHPTLPWHSCGVEAKPATAIPNDQQYFRPPPPTPNK